jgi:hypothetical protein
MIVVNRLGASWVVRRDGRPLAEYNNAGVHKTKASAVKSARRLLREDEELEVEGGLEDVEQLQA